MAATGYERKHAIKLLNRKISQHTEKPKQRAKRPYYDEAVIQVLKQIWHASNQICSKRIIPFMPELLSALEKHGHLSLDGATRSKVLSVSSATFDRLLKAERINVRRGISTTTPGTILKNQIKVRTFSDWNEKEPGFFEADLVVHCGKTVSGAFVNTLVMTDIVTTWTECIALIRKSADDVIMGLDTASELLPFKILGFDVDNAVHGEIKLEMQIKPNITAKELLEKLMTKYPNQFYLGHTRTLQRRLNELRKEFDQRELKYQQLMVSKKFMTTNPIEGIL